MPLHTLNTLYCEFLEGDCWFLDVTPTTQWYEFQHHDCKPRLWHRAQYVAGELLVVGGHKGNILDPVGRKVSVILV